MSFRILAAAWMIVAGNALSVPREAEDIALRLERIREAHHLPALAGAAVDEGEIVAIGATGLRRSDEEVPVTMGDIWHLGSCTKSMTASVCAMLVEDGKMRWDMTIAEVFPDWRKAMQPAWRSVKLEQLLVHRGGAPRDPPADLWAAANKREGTPTEQRYEFIQAVLRLPPEAPPGSKFIYSNQGYAIAGAMLEKLTGKPWEQLMRERIFAPLGMKSSGFGVPGTIGQIDQPWGHTRAGGQNKPVQSDNPPGIGPAGTVHGSLDDLARYTMLHLRRGQGTNALLKPETFRRLHTPPAGAEYAAGWISLERGWAGGKALMHNGSNTMWYLVMWLAPERNFAVIAATNIAGPEAEKGCDEVASAMIEKWLGR